MKIAFASDHAGLTLRQELVEHAKKRGHEVIDFGTQTSASVDYPDFAVKVAEAVASGAAPLGVLVCGTGIGMSITANKVRHVRAAVCRTEFEAKMARAHNQANVLCLGQRVTGPGLASEILDAFLATPFEGGRHQNRVDKIEKVEGSQR